MWRNLRRSSCGGQRETAAWILDSQALKAVAPLDFVAPPAEVGPCLGIKTRRIVLNPRCLQHPVLQRGEATLVPIDQIHPSKMMGREEPKLPRLQKAREELASGAAIAPVAVFYHYGEYLLADGMHRYTAAKEMGLTHLPCVFWESAWTISREESELTIETLGTQIRPAITRSARWSPSAFGRPGTPHPAFHPWIFCRNPSACAASHS